MEVMGRVLPGCSLETKTRLSELDQHLLESKFPAESRLANLTDVHAERVG
jgi:hypothetical protein